VIAFICEHKDPRVDSDLLESFPRLRCVTNATGIGPGMSHLNTLTKLVSDLSRLGCAALGNRTPDLRITRSPAPRSSRATCTDSSTRVPECSERTRCSGLPVHDPVHGLASLLVTGCHWHRAARSRKTAYFGGGQR
jgi:hypothetical protein